MKALTPRQQLVLVGLRQGLRLEEIGARLQLSVRTIYRDMNDAVVRLGVPEGTAIDRSGLVERAMIADQLDENLRLDISGRLTVSPRGAVLRGLKDRRVIE